MDTNHESRFSNSRNARSYTDNILIKYKCEDEAFIYPESASLKLTGVFDERPLWQIMSEDGLSSEETAASLRSKIKEIANSDDSAVFYTEYRMLDFERNWKWYRVGIISTVPKNDISITFTDIEDEIAYKSRLELLADYDNLTGLYNREYFCRRVEEITCNDEAGVLAGDYALVYFDILRFKAVNELFGVSEGDKLLQFIAGATEKIVGNRGFVCRLNSDRFIFFAKEKGDKLTQMIDELFEKISNYDLNFEITCNAGIYIIYEYGVGTDYMIDRAILAQSTIKGSYTVKYNFYSEEQRKNMLGEQEIVGVMSTALAEKQFVLYYQPQYDHSTGILIGVEALVRWKHPERGLISPGIFIPIFEKNGFVTKLDLYVFEHICIFLRRCLDEELSVVPVSANFSYHDIFSADFVDKLEKIRRKYNIPSDLLRIEITESAAVVNSERTISVVEKLHEYGYVVEMDDFGSGYSSLNVLKDIEVDVLKLDMLFLHEQSGNNRGGTILSSVVRMAKWLGMPVIAEGVENIGQADFLKSIGCNYIQGYLYSKPIPEEEFYEVIKNSTIGEAVPQLRLIDSINAFNFWDPKSQETFVFNYYVGPAAIFTYTNGKVEVLRVNQKYVKEFRMNLVEKDLLVGDPMRFFDEANRRIYTDMLKRSIESMGEEECETWRTITTPHCDGERMCIKTNVRMIGRSGETYIFYSVIKNMTSERNFPQEVHASGE